MGARQIIGQNEMVRYIPVVDLATCSRTERGLDKVLTYIKLV